MPAILADRHRRGKARAHAAAARLDWAGGNRL